MDCGSSIKPTRRLGTGFTRSLTQLDAGHRATRPPGLTVLCTLHPVPCTLYPASSGGFLVDDQRQSQ
jgi:hypothetical protein